VEIEVAVDNSGLRTDVDIARSAEQALQWVTYLPNGTIKVMVEKVGSRYLARSTGTTSVKPRAAQYAT